MVLVAITPALIASENTVKLTQPTLIDRLEVLVEITHGDTSGNTLKLTQPTMKGPLTITHTVIASGYTVQLIKPRAIDRLEGSCGKFTHGDSLGKYRRAHIIHRDRLLRGLYWQ
jgi:hypothetical protein